MQLKKINPDTGRLCLLPSMTTGLNKNVDYLCHN